MTSFGRTVLLQLGNQTVGRSFGDFRVRFNIQKTLKSEPNSADIEIYGLNRTSIAQYLAQNRDLRVRLMAGYQDTPALLFDGFPVKKDGLIFEDTGYERILKIRAKDGLRRYEKARINVTLGEEATFEDVLVELAGGLGLPLDTIEIPADVTLTQGRTMHGQVTEYLDRLAENSNADWSIQDGKFQFIQKRGRRRGEGPLFSSSLKNIVGNVRRRDKGIEVTSFIGGAIVPGTIFRVRTEEGFYDGDYKAKEVRYTGDSFYDNDFYAVVYGEPYTSTEDVAKANQTTINRINQKVGDLLLEGAIQLSKLIDPSGGDPNAPGGPVDFN